MTTERTCCACGKPLPASAEDLCPECLMKAGFGTGVAPEPGQPTRTAKFTPPGIEELAGLFPQMEILELLGQGGMGAVYKARQRTLDRMVALKILPPQAGGDSGFAERFTREDRALARLIHPNIVAVHEFGKARDFHYFIMEFVDGANMRQIERAGKLAPAEALRIIPQICEALQFAHDEGIVHRDIKPDNILVDKRGRVKIADFGIAKILGTDSDATLTGEKDVVGTPHYMAPEQVESPQTVDHRADIYALGVVFYEMLTGELPLGKFAPPSRKVQVDVRLDDVVLHALEKEPDRRYQHASEVKTDVENLAAGGRSDAGQVAGSSRDQLRARELAASPPLWGQRVIQFVGLGALLLFACLMVLLGMTSNAIGAKTWSYFRLGLEVFAGIIFIVFLYAIYRAVRTRTPEAWRTVRSWSPMMVLVVLGIVFGFWSPRLLPIQSDYIGQMWFPDGDSINIRSVSRTRDRIAVKGTYTLVSEEKAELALFITSTNKSGPVEPTQRMQIARGAGGFELIQSHPVPGMPHISMYDEGGSCFAALYFGTRAEAKEEGNASWITNRSLHRASSGPGTSETK